MNVSIIELILTKNQGVDSHLKMFTNLKINDLTTLYEYETSTKNNDELKRVITLNVKFKFDAAKLIFRNVRWGVSVDLRIEFK